MLLRILLLPFGFIFRLILIALDGSRDLHNKIRYSKSIIDKGCCITSNSIISPNSHILDDTLIINSTIGSFSYISYRGIIKNATIGKYCSIANDVNIGLGKHPIHDFSTSTLFYRVKNTFNFKMVKKDSDFEEYQRIDIGNDVWIGARAIIMDGVKIGNGAVIGANSVVTKNIPDYAIAVGSPAKIIKYRFENDNIVALLASEWWNLSIEELTCFIENYHKTSL